MPPGPPPTTTAFGPSSRRAGAGRWSRPTDGFSAQPTPPDLVPRCEQAGIFGAVAGVVGTMQATEVLKELLGLGEGLAGSLLLYDALSASVRRIRAKRDPDCPLCGTHPTIRDLSGHA